MDFQIDEFSQNMKFISHGSLIMVFKFFKYFFLLDFLLSVIYSFAMIIRNDCFLRGSIGIATKSRNNFLWVLYSTEKIL